jgi:hypothetical protein
MPTTVEISELIERRADLHGGRRRLGLTCERVTLAGSDAYSW